MAAENYGSAILQWRWVRVLAALCAVPLVAFAFTDVAKSAPAAPFQTFVLIDGPNAGDTINTSSDGQTVYKTKNVHIDASGTVALPDSGCFALHFMGRINGAPNPDPRCGQGIVVPLDASELNGERGIIPLITFAIIDERNEQEELAAEAHHKQGKSREFLDSSLHDLTKLGDALGDAHRNGTITDGQELELSRIVDDAIIQDNKARELLGKDDKRAAALVKSAVAEKRKFVRSLPPTVTGIYLKDTPQFQAADLGAGGGLALNDLGLAAGVAPNPTTGLVQPFRFNHSLSLLSVPAGQLGVGRSINRGGIVGGYTLGPAGQAAGIWLPDGTYVPLAGLSGPTGKENAVYGCPDVKPVVCYGTSDLDAAAHATYWSAVTTGATPQAIGDFPGASGAFAVNNRSVFGGSFFDSGSAGPYSPYIASTATKKELVLWRPTGGSGVVLGLNDLTIAGGSVNDAAGKHAALWWGAQHAVLGPTTMPSTIRGVNNLGLAIGDVGIPGQTHAALFLGGRTVDLSNAVSGYTLTKGDAVNNKDQVLVDGVNAQGQTHVLLLTPKPAAKR